MSVGTPDEPQMCPWLPQMTRPPCLMSLDVGTFRPIKPLDEIFANIHNNIRMGTSNDRQGFIPLLGVHVGCVRPPHLM